MSFGDNLRALIEERDITQKELAKKLNIAPSTLGSYVQNVREPDFATLKMFANFFDVSTDYLLDHSVKEYSTRQENELLRVFRSLSEEQQYICIEQSKVFMLVNQKRKEEIQKSGYSLNDVQVFGEDRGLLHFFYQSIGKMVQ